MAVWNESIVFEVDGFPGCCGIAVVFNGERLENVNYDDNSDLLYTDIYDFPEFVKHISREQGRVGVILFSDNPDGPLDRLYNELQPTAPWVKEDYVQFKNPKSGNPVVLKALVRKE